MSVTAKEHAIDSLAHKLKEETGVSVTRCYQCGKCTAGCPMAEEMDYTPSHILRLLQVGLDGFEEYVLRSYSPWVCLTCEMCYARCPQEVDIPKMMDFIRAESARQKKVNPRAKDFLSFHKTMLDSIKYVGRLYEVGMILGYKARSWHILDDIMLGPTLFFKGKLKLFPHFIKNRKNLSQIFKKSGNAHKEAAK
jgi:heterodisulfide reductase subunit C2